MPNRCICYTSDAGYLFPTFVSAVQARQHTPTNIADVIIFSIGTPAELNRIFSYACAVENIRFISVPSSQIENASAMLARLFLNRILPNEYDQLLYIDGDTQITGALTPLLHAATPANQFCAASDPMIFSLPGGRQHGQNISQYFTSLGLDSTKQSNYFNSGVLRINRNGWDEIGRSAWNLFQKLRGNTHYPDQDALNLVAMEQRLPMSLTWNFPVFLRNAGLEHEITPRIVHYMGSPKPWHGEFMPWKLAEYEIYLETARKHPSLVPFLTHISWRRRLKYRLQQRYKQAQEHANWGNEQRRREILNYENYARAG